MAKKLCQCGAIKSGKNCSKCSKASGSYSDKQKAYKTRSWQNTSRQHRIDYPLCVHCLRQDVMTSIHPSDDRGCVDHIIPFKSETDPLFMDTRNHQGLCPSCHDDKTKLEVAGLYTRDMIQRDLDERAKAIGVNQ